MPAFARGSGVRIRGGRVGSAWGTWCRSTVRRTTGSRGAGGACTLIVYVDDATTRLLATAFFAEETTEAYMRTTRAHLEAHGRPVA